MSCWVHTQQTRNYGLQQEAPTGSHGYPVLSQPWKTTGLEKQAPPHYLMEHLTYCTRMDTQVMHRFPTTEWSIVTRRRKVTCLLSTSDKWYKKTPKNTLLHEHKATFCSEKNTRMQRISSTYWWEYICNMPIDLQQCFYRGKNFTSIQTVEQSQI